MRAPNHSTWKGPLCTGSQALELKMEVALYTNKSVTRHWVGKVWGRVIENVMG